MSSFYNINGINSGAVIGTIIAFIGGTVPTGWLLCDGSAIPSEYAVLIDLLGTNLLPNLTDNRMMYGKNSKSDSSINDGSNSLTLVTNNLPAHSHNVNITDATHNHVITEVGQTKDNIDNEHGYANTNTGHTGGAKPTDNEAAIATGSTTDTHTHPIYFNDMRAVSGTTPPSNSGFTITNPYYTVKWIIKGI